MRLSVRKGKARVAGPMYSIGPGGLSPTQGKEMKLKPGIIAWLGASSSPDQIIITKIDDKMITFRRYPYSKDQRIDRRIGEDLIAKGTKTWLQHYGSHWPDEAKRAKDLLAGKDVKPVNVAKYIKAKEPIKVLVRPIEGADYSKGNHPARGNDPWYILEQFGNVGGLQSKESPTGEDYEVDTDRERLEELKKDKRFKIIKVEPRKTVDRTMASVRSAKRTTAWDRRLAAMIASGEVQVGQTWENDKVRVHRFRPSYHIWDLTNAGKRGKKVRRLAFYDLDMIRDEKVKGNVEKFAKGIDKVKDYEQALKWVQIIIKDARNRGSSQPQMEEYQERGVDVAPGGFKPLRIVGKGVRVDSDYDSFSVQNVADQNNLPTCIPAIRGGKKDIKVFYRWVKDNQEKIKQMDFQQVLKEMKKIGINYHQYCAMD